MADTFETHFNRAVEIAGGSETKLAAAAGFSQNAVWHAKRIGRVSAQMAVRIEAATGGQVSRHDLRPDLFGPPASTALNGEGKAGAVTGVSASRAAPADRTTGAAA